jgi:hypothetical protein
MGASCARCAAPHVARHGAGRRSDEQSAEQAAADGEAPLLGGRPVPVGGTDEHDDGRVHVEPGRDDHPDRPAGDLQRHSPGSAGAVEHRLPAVDDHGLPAGAGGVRGEPRPAGRHPGPGQDLQPGLRGVHGGLDPAVAGSLHRPACGAVADRLALPAGVRRLDALGELGRDPDRRLPAGAARLRPGREPDRDPRRAVHRADRRGAARGVGLAGGVLGERAGRHRGDLVGVLPAAGQRGAAPGTDRLVGQRHLRDRPERDPRRGHLRDPVLRRPHDGLVGPGGDRGARRRRGIAGRFRGDRAESRRAPVPAAPIQDQGVHGRQPHRVHRSARVRRPAVRADHLAAGHLAAVARLRLQPDAVLGRHLRAAADGRILHRRPPIGRPVRPVRGALVRFRRHARSSP